MFNPQQTSNTNLTSLYQSPNPNFNMVLSQPVLPSELPSSGPVLNTPATDPFGPPGSNLSNSGGFDGQPPIHDDPNAGSLSLVAQQADPITHVVATDSLNVKSMVSTGLCNPGNNILTDQHLVNKVKKTVQKKTKVIQSMRCEVCDIDLNSSDDYEIHILGKKHKKKSEKLNNPATTVFNASSATAGEGLDTNRQKLVEGVATDVLIRVCTMCNVVCNSQEMFDNHLAGKMHAEQAWKPPQYRMELSVAAFSNYISEISPMVLRQDQWRGPCESYPNKTIADQFAWCEVCCNYYCTSYDIISPMVLPQDNKSDRCESDPNKPSADHAARCEVCNIYCTIDDEHKMGKKHLKNLEKLKRTETDTSTPAPANVPITTVPVTRPMVEVSRGKTNELQNENTVESHATRDDSDMKRRKIMEGQAVGMEQSVAVNPNFVSGISPMVFPQDNKNSRCESGPNKTREDSETKKRKVMEGGSDGIEQSVAADQFARSEVRNIYCTSNDVIVHKKKRRRKKRLTKTGTPASTHAPVTTVPVPEPMKNPEVSLDETEGLKNESVTESRAPGEDSEKEKCKKRRRKKRLTKTGTPASTHAPVTTVPVPEHMKNSEVSLGETEGVTESRAPGEDSEKEKCKVMEGEQSVTADLDTDSKVLPQDNKNGAWCVLCNVYCTSHNVLIEHTSGKKHLKNLEKLTKTETDTSTPASTHAPVMTVPVPRPMNNPEVSQGETEGLRNENATESQVPREDSEKKKHEVMEGGSDGIEQSFAADQFATKTGTPASIHAPVKTVPDTMKTPEVSLGETEVIKNERVTESRASGEDSEKEKRKVIEGGADGIEQSVAADLNSDSGISSNVLPQDNKNGACESHPKKTSAEEFVRCELCNVCCTSHIVLMEHTSGKKHLKNLKKLKNMEAETTTGTPASSNASVMLIPVTGPMENPETSQGKIDDLKNPNAVESQTPKEDLETKKRKFMETETTGTPASSNAVESKEDSETKKLKFMEV